MELDTRRLQYLVEVARMGSLSRAAEVLSVTQPALSRAIAQIEERYGFAIFDRGRHGARLTREGRQVIAESTRILRAVTNLHADMQSYGAGTLGIARFGFGPMLASMGLGPISRDVISRNAGLQMQCSIKTPQELTKDLLSEEIDFFICPGNIFQNDQLISVEKLCRLDYSLFARHGHPLSHLEVVSDEDVYKFPVAGTFDLISQGHGKFNKGLICDNYNVILDLTSSTDTICIADMKIIENCPNFVNIVPIYGYKINIEDYVSLFKISGKINTPAIDVVIECARNYYRNMI